MKPIAWPSVTVQLLVVTTALAAALPAAAQRRDRGDDRGFDRPAPRSANDRGDRREERVDRQEQRRDWALGQREAVDDRGGDRDRRDWPGEGGRRGDDRWDDDRRDGDYRDNGYRDDSRRGADRWYGRRGGPGGWSVYVPAQYHLGGDERERRRRWAAGDLLDGQRGWSEEEVRGYERSRGYDQPAVSVHYDRSGYPHIPGWNLNNQRHDVGYRGGGDPRRGSSPRRD
ncbi:hypothetical protein Mal64_16400 [Pseudobythopirellula maris]|uniref:Uncharacterized protein n=1 Tax=Pseudobythopirellula maris TaxID=2527991 RepID=A0A5C5ZP00_9BACT|nr:hypothetical protein [Pseudobythopirellula maris]TWT88163.1 hypothetical protein Mal64_16400 [Pseudobythopirellula maris]